MLPVSAPSPRKLTAPALSQLLGPFLIQSRQLLAF